MKLANPPEPQGCGMFCEHLASADPPEDIGRYYRGTDYALVCLDCIARHKETTSSPNLVPVTDDQFSELESNLLCDGVMGELSYPCTEASLHFSKESYSCRLDLVAVHGHRGRWLGLSREGDLVDLRQHKVLSRLEAGKLSLEERIDLICFDEYVIAVNTYGQFGGVFDLESGQCRVRLNREKYHTTASKFPVALANVRDQILLIHATDWNQLHITNLSDGKAINRRDVGQSLDYFHAGLSISPNREWIVSNGWHWHPMGQVRSWSLHRWLEIDPCEPEVGTSVKDLARRNSYWDGPVCWLNNHTLAVWGHGEDEFWLTPAALFFDVRTGQQIGWFPGPEIQGGELFGAGGMKGTPAFSPGFLAFDTYLFSVSDKGTGVWDVATGTRLHHDPDHRPVAWSEGEFLSVEPGSVTISKLAGQL